ncbi:hypothetical protein DFQ28_010819 [Apophysomyces sp. BC1034]|nr:hypothetical protein DFQ30_010568 [Apophysomyces sp. BC1015]KAG0170214.1 hypothetical protein DFQ29_009372 [Apophysomyces sp. BC1021]KAG0184624.1 hypothetical protein DFQ28_010819 [Apophysomyces sp. BC1034]
MNDIAGFQSSFTSQEYTHTTAARIPQDTTNPSFYDLQDVIHQYRSQPELLKLILTSKVEEDKRRAEEAKLRAKELDLYLQENSRRLSVHSYSDTDGSGKSEGAAPRSKRRTAPYHIPQRRKNSLTDHQERRHSAAAAMLAMGTLTVHSQSDQSTELTTPSPTSPISSAAALSSLSTSYPSPIADQYDDEEDEIVEEEQLELTSSGRPRRRREMQAITKIVETREFPYLDDYFWKNNGNTTQKKTGCKSIYYKCSNSNKGCPVNKTVTARPNGEYLIKYRGNHLPECGRVERIRDL